MVCFFSRRSAFLITALVGMLITTGTARGDLRIKLDPPGEREFILDKAQLIAAGEGR
ncbi:MAG: hypothetical protein JXM70_00575 [Pirellulales bacterium]|nr:hypothetical protein [Pirellulales bacterium]